MTQTTNWKNVNNWHWVEKNCIPWAKTYIESFVKSYGKVSISKVSSFSGDADINQRKGKLITVFDLAFTLDFVFNSKDDSIKGKITVPEFMHDSDIDDNLFSVTIENDSGSELNKVVKDLVRNDALSAIKDKLKIFSAEMIKENSKDVHIPSSEMNGHPILPVYAPKPPPVHEVKSSVKSDSITSTRTLTMNVEFVCSPKDLFESLVVEQRAKVWTRGAASINNSVGGEFALFGGNVTGKFLELIPDSKIVMEWRLKTWPASHMSTVTIDLEACRESVKLKLSQTNVPLGDLELTRKNWEGYYWNGIKGAFGYGAVGF